MSKELGKKVSIKNVLNKKAYIVVDNYGSMNLRTLDYLKSVSMSLGICEYGEQWKVLYSMGYRCVLCSVSVSASPVSS